jgi:hypothetical protein
MSGSSTWHRLPVTLRLVYHITGMLVRLVGNPMPFIDRREDTLRDWLSEVNIARTPVLDDGL